jgi:hypothetical protein
MTGGNIVKKEDIIEKNLLKTIKFLNEVFDKCKIKEFSIELLEDKIKKKGL